MGHQESNQTKNFQKYNTKSCYMQSFSTLASLCSWTGWIEPYQVTIPEVRFSYEMVHIIHVL